MSLQHVKTHFLLLLADVTNLLPAKGQYFNEKRYRKYFHHNFIIMLLFQGAPSPLHLLQAANNPTELMCRNVPHSLISAFRWCLHKCNSRLPFAIQLPLCFVQASMKMQAEPKMWRSRRWIEEVAWKEVKAGLEKAWE